MTKSTEGSGHDQPPCSRLSASGPDGESSRVSRRGFLTAVGLGATAAAVGDRAGAETPGPVRSDAGSSGPDAVPVELRVNGEKLQLKLEPRVTLLDALRDHIRVDVHEYVDLTGAKRVCDRASCGACTVMIDGKTAYSCSVLAIEAQGELGFPFVAALHFWCASSWRAAYRRGERSLPLVLAHGREDEL